MNTGNLLVHKWIMASFPHIVAEYLEYNDAEAFNPIQLLCAVEDEHRDNNRKDNKGKLSAIVRYWDTVQKQRWKQRSYFIWPWGGYCSK